jgi:predicted RNA methylase
MNPPFGTKHNSGMDMKFLEIASKLAKHTIYSLHKSSTRNYVLKKGLQFGFHSEVLAELEYDIPQTYKFHKKKAVNIKVDFIRFSCKR